MRFRGRRFIPLDPPDFLDHEGAEIVLIGAKPGVAALGVRLLARHETDATAEIFTELRMEKSPHPVGPLLEGKWEEGPTSGRPRASLARAVPIRT